MASIELTRVGFCYENGIESSRALDGVDLTIQDGEFVCIIGPSGCGKSTLLRLLAGLERPGEGSIRIDGQPVKGPGTDRMIVFQDYALFPWLTARKNVSFAVRQSHRSLSREEAVRVSDEFLARVDMAVEADRYPSQLSGGQRQRVAIARALAMDPDILLLDEPFGALDARNRRQLQTLLEQLWQNAGGHRKTVVFVTHDVHEAVLLADRVIFMQPDRVAAELTIPLPRPRDEENREFIRLRERLLGLFDMNGEGVDRHEPKAE